MFPETLVTYLEDETGDETFQTFVYEIYIQFENYHRLACMYTIFERNSTL